MSDVRSLGEVHVPAEPSASGPRRTTRDDLVAWARANLRHRKLVVVSNREPYSHVRDQGAVRWQRNAGGLTVALDSVTQALGGVWVAHGSGNADRAMADEYDRVRVPARRPALHAAAGLALARGLRPLLLGALRTARSGRSATSPTCGRASASRTGSAIATSTAASPRRCSPRSATRRRWSSSRTTTSALVARFLKEQRPDLEVLLFWHIPWPNPEVFRIFPWKQELLEGMLANDLVGFHIRNHAQNFLDSVASELEARVDRERLAVERGGKRTWVRHFPISVNAERDRAPWPSRPRRARRSAAIAIELGLEGCKIGLGVDRMDYTKGIPERLEALERMLEKYPEWIGRLCFIQIGVPSRIELKEYRDVLNRTRALAERINLRFPCRAPASGPSGDRADDGGSGSNASALQGAAARTVHLIEENLDFRELVPYYRMADLCAVTSLHDGMNLVAKEYLAATLRPGRRARAVAVHGRGARAGARLAGIAVRPRSHGRCLPRGAVGAARSATRAHEGAARDRAPAQHLRLGDRGVRHPGTPHPATPAG